MDEERFQTVKDIYACLGRDVTIIPIGWGSKIPKIKNWQKLRPNQTKSEGFQKQLGGEVNLGVVLGENSYGLCTVDIDSDDLVGPFLKQNPMLNETLQTKGKRGVNLWFRAEGEVPRVVKIDGFGELRGTGGQTVIKGKHPEGMSYRILNKASPVSLAIDDLKFPPPRNHSPESNSESINYIYTYMACRSEPGMLERQRIINETDKEVKNWKESCSDKRLVEAWVNYFENDYEPDFSSRNDILVKLATNLHGKICFRLGCQLAEIFHQLYKPMFKDSITAHMKEFTSHLRAVEQTFLQSLLPEERTFYQNLEECQQDAFRICRSLASCEYPGYPPPTFFLSYGEIAKRLMLEDAKTSYRILKKLKAFGVIELLKKGTVWTPGIRSKASVWKWRFSIHEISPSPPESTLR